MAKPWEKYGAAPAATGGAKPWEKYAAKTAPAAPTPEAPAPQEAASPLGDGFEPGMLGTLQKMAMKSHGPMAVAMNPAVRDVFTRGMDYLAGGVRTLGFGAAGVADMDDAEAALKGKAPRFGDYLKKADVPMGGSVNLPLVGDVSARDVGGFAGDVLTDPLTYVAPGSRMGKINSEVGPAVEATGKKVYKSGLTRIDQEAAEYGKEPVSDLLHNERVWGSERSISDKIQEMADDRLAQRNKILQGATDAGADVDMQRAVKEAQDYVDHLRGLGDHRQQGAIDKMQAAIDGYRDTQGGIRFTPKPEVKGYAAATDRAETFTPGGSYIGQPNDTSILYDIKGGNPQSLATSVVDDAADQIVSLPVQGSMVHYPGPTPIQTTAWKSSAANNAGDAAWQDLSRSSEGKRFEKALSRGHRIATEESVGRALGEDAAQALNKQNDELGRLITTQDRADQVANIAERKHTMTQVKGGLIAGGMAKVAAAMEAAKFFGGAAGRTGGGLLLEDLGQSRIPDVAARRMMINSSNPWTDMEKKK